MNKSIAVFGAGPGLGQAIAHRYASEGYDLVEEFLPDMLDHGDGAILTSQGASSVRGLPNLSGPGPAQAAQRNYLQSLHAELADKGVYVGSLYIGAIIEKSAFHTWTLSSDGGGRDWGPTVDPGRLAEMIWTMHADKGPAEAAYPETVLDQWD